LKETVFILAAFFAFFSLLIFSLILNIRDWRWMADIEMEAGQKKLANINYERLELSRWRASWKIECIRNGTSMSRN